MKKRTRIILLASFVFSFSILPVFADHYEYKQTSDPNLEVRVLIDDTGQRSDKWEYRTTNGKGAKIHVTSTSNMRNVRVEYSWAHAPANGDWSTSKIVFDPIDNEASYSYSFSYEVIWQ